MNQRSTLDPLRIGGRPIWNWLSSPGAHAVASALVLLVVTLVVVSQGSVPATAVRFLSVIAVALAGAAGIRLAAGPRVWGDAWLDYLEAARLAERVAVPFWSDELPGPERERLQSNALKGRFSVPVGLLVAGPLLVAASVAFIAFGLPRQTAQLELEQGETVEFLVSADGQRQRMQGSLRLDSVGLQDGHWVAVLTGSDLSGQSSRTTPLREGERWRIGDWSVQLSSVAPTSLAGAAELTYDGLPLSLVRGVAVDTAHGTIELLDGRFSFLGQLGPAVLVRQTLAGGQTVDEWVFERAGALHERLGVGPGAMRLQELRPALGATLTAASSGPLVLPSWIAWAGVVLMALAGALLASGGVWLRGRDGDYELVAWGAATRRQRLLTASQKALGLPERASATPGSPRWLIVIALIGAAAIPAIVLGQDRAFVMLPLVAASVGVALMFPRARAAALALGGAVLASLMVFATAGDAGTTTSSVWLASVGGSAIVAVAVAMMLAFVAEQGERAARAGGMLIGASGLVLLLVKPMLFGLGSSEGPLVQLSVWASSDALEIFAQRFAGPVSAAAWPAVGVVLVLSLLVLAVPRRVGIGLAWGVAGAGLAAAAAARSAATSIDSLASGAPDVVGLQLVERFWAGGVGGGLDFASPAAPWAFVGLAAAVFVAWPAASSETVEPDGLPGVVGVMVTAAAAAASLAIAQTVFHAPTAGVGLVTASVFSCGAASLFVHGRYLRRPGLAASAAVVSLFCVVCWSLLL